MMESRIDKERQGKTRKDKERQGKTRKDKERQGKTRKDKERQGKTELKNETIRVNAKVTPVKSVLTQNRLSWYGHVMRREETHITRSTLSMKVTGTRPRGRPNMRRLDRLKSDICI